MNPSQRLRALGAASALAALGALPATAQVRYSIDWHGPTIATPDSATFTPITEGDVLMPPGGAPALGPLPPPAIALTGGPGGLGIPAHPGCVGHAPGTMCAVEVDALSDGQAYDMSGPGAAVPGGNVWFSVDEFAVGLPNPFVPNIPTEAPCGDSSGDVWVDLGLMPGPLPPFAVPPSHVGALDGDGLPSCSGFAYPGLGLKEPNPPGLPPDTGDHVDALVTRQASLSAVLYFSLDSGWIDPFTGIPNSGSALANGFVGGDVLVNTGGGPPALFAPAPLLGLDLIAGPDSDDLDALAVLENGTGVFEPSITPYDWLSGNTDMVLFSVRRGSAVIGAPDSFFGIPIEEGDILTTPLPFAAGGVSPFPAIFIAAENLGLATLRSGVGVNIGDDLTALDTRRTPLSDCDGDGVDDAVAIALGIVPDTNLNGIPDPCEAPLWTPYCFCPVGPCLNNDPNAGCRNSTGAGALLTAAGTTSVAADNLILTATGLPVNQFGIFYYGTAQVAIPFGDGLRCVGGQTRRILPPQNSGPAGTMTLGPGIVAYSQTGPPLFWITPFTTWNFQCWYRDPAGPCQSTFNFSNAMSVFFVP